MFGREAAWVKSLNLVARSGWEVEQSMEVLVMGSWSENQAKVGYKQRYLSAQYKHMMAPNLPHDSITVLSTLIHTSIYITQASYLRNPLLEFELMWPAFETSQKAPLHHRYRPHPASDTHIFTSTQNTQKPSEA